MITLCLVLSIIVFIASISKASKEKKKEAERSEEYYWEDNEFGTSDVYVLVALFSVIAVGVFLIWDLNLACNLGTNSVVMDEKIAMYQEENKKIEESIDTKVQLYMAYEAETYASLKDKDAIDLVTLFPELQSDELVKEQIKVYTKNNDKIKKLKEKKINLSKVKWKLYFGK